MYIGGLKSYAPKTMETVDNRQKNKNPHSVKHANPRQMHSSNIAEWKRLRFFF
jgi:hypothetical protein